MKKELDHKQPHILPDGSTNVKIKTYELYHEGEKVRTTHDLKEAEEFVENSANNAFTVKGAYIGSIDGIDDIVPDASVTISEMERYGYQYVFSNQMLPLSQERALEFFNLGLNVYLLYEDDTEGLVIDESNILNHRGMYGIESADWERGKKIIEHERRLTNNEEAFRDIINSSETAYGIFQLSERHSNREIMFESLDYLHEKGLKPEKKNYHLVYAAQNENLSNYPNDVRQELVAALPEKLFEKFNTDDKPVDFLGHSLSVSDVVVIKDNDNITAHYCDRFGFKQIDDFLDNNHVAEKKCRKRRRNVPLNNLCSFVNTRKIDNFV